MAPFLVVIDVGHGHNPERVALFLMRSLFTMFAEDIGLLPKNSFRDLLRGCEAGRRPSRR
jgi:hypothetical protein